MGSGALLSLGCGAPKVKVGALVVVVEGAPNNDGVGAGASVGFGGSAGAKNGLGVSDSFVVAVSFGA